VASIEVRDPYTRGHSERVTAYSLALAQTLGLPDEEREVVELAALLHDVGKIGVPETILNKPGALDEAEFRILRAHPVHGEEIVRHVRHEHVARIAHAVRHHHERWDGRGYPDALPGEQLALSARILGVADAWDAMTSDRPYRRALDRGKALAILTENAGTQFDPAVVAAFGTAFTAGAIDQAARLEGPATSGRFLLKRAAPVVRPTP
jgi:putative nucleotidyltransferase with HDIG domain